MLRRVKDQNTPWLMGGGGRERLKVIMKGVCYFESL